MTGGSDIDDSIDLDPETLQAFASQASRANLEPLTPEDGLRMYVELREDEVTSSTLKSHRSRLQFFIEWCEENGIDNLNDLTGRDLQAFRSHRKDGLTVSTLETNMRTVRTFLRKCVKLDAVPANLPDKVEIPSVSTAENSREEFVSGERSNAILDHLDTYEYGTIEHVVWLLMTSAGLRVSALLALDVDDYTTTEDGGKIELCHRPDSGTRLKNGADSERVIHVSEYVSKVLEDYLADLRPNVTDDFGRKPLLATEHGRIVATTIRKYGYKWTRPCVTGSCPHGKADDEVEACEATQTSSTAYKCPSSSSPHTVRRGYITSELNAGVPKPVLSDRCDVTPDVIEEYYDERSETEKMELRKEIRESVYGDSEETGYGQ